jgi:pyrroline-5-carboxylate reductase
MLDTILLVGCGNMGGAMLAGWLAAGSHRAVSPCRSGAGRVPAGVTLLRALPGGAKFDVILLGVKPQLLADIAPTIAPLAGADIP